MRGGSQPSPYATAVTQLFAFQLRLPIIDFGYLNATDSLARFRHEFYLPPNLNGNGTRCAPPTSKPVAQTLALLTLRAAGYTYPLTTNPLASRARPFRMSQS